MDQFSNPSEQRALPNATAVLVLGILSIVVCFIKTGRICAIIGIVLQGVAVLVYIIIFVVALGAIGASGGFN